MKITRIIKYRTQRVKAAYDSVATKVFRAGPSFSGFPRSLLRLIYNVSKPEEPTQIMHSNLRGSSYATIARWSRRPPIDHFHRRLDISATGRRRSVSFIIGVAGLSRSSSTLTLLSDPRKGLRGKKSKRPEGVERRKEGQRWKGDRSWRRWWFRSTNRRTCEG